MKISYHFKFEDNTQKKFDIHLHPERLYIILPNNKEKPDWARFSFYTCPHCRVNKDENEYCPVAVSICDIVGFFKKYPSYEIVEVSVIADDRSYWKKTTLQNALSSLLGIYMVTSGCPHTKKLKPVVRFHLPFSPVKETLFRSAGAYLLGQYFLQKQGKKADFEMFDLVTFYKEIQIVNHGLTERLKGVLGEDSINNAVICLDVFAKELPYAVEDGLEELRDLFHVYWEQIDVPDPK